MSYRNRARSAYESARGGSTNGKRKQGDEEREQPPPPQPEVEIPRDQWPEPPAPEAYYGLAGEIVRTLEPETEADPVAILVQLMAAYGNVIGRGAWFTVESDRHHANLFAVLVGQSAKARKGLSWSRVRQLFDEVENNWLTNRVMTGLSSGQGLTWQVRDPIMGREPIKEKGRIVGYQEVETDPGVTDKRLLVIEPEFANVLRQIERNANTLSGVLRNAWDGRELRDMVKHSPARARDAHVSMVGHITSDELRRYLTATESANGFANRFLWVYTRRVRLLPDGDQFGTMQPFVQQLSRAIAFGRQAGAVRRDDQARAIWHKVYPQLSADRHGLAGSLTARAEAQTMRLALIYALLDCSPAIRAEHLTAALALWEFCERSVRHVFGDSTGDTMADEALLIIRRSPEGITRTQVSDFIGCKSRNDYARLAQALGVLLRYGLATCRTVETGGRPAEVWYPRSRAEEKGD